MFRIAQKNKKRKSKTCLKLIPPNFTITSNLTLNPLDQMLYETDPKVGIWVGHNNEKNKLERKLKLLEPPSRPITHGYYLWKLAQVNLIPSYGLDI